MCVELFAIYGDGWFETRIEDFPHTPYKRSHYLNADLLLYKYEYLVPEQDFESPLAWNLLDLLHDVLNLWKPALSKVLPREPPEADRVLQQYGNDFQMTTAKGSTPNYIRSLEWLEEHGFCVDALVAGKSSLPNTGRGAFATKHIPKGEYVTAVPLLQAYRKRFTMEWSDGYEVLWRGEQLLLNYCFGRKDSNVLLFPYGPVVTHINHARPANVALRWSDRMPAPERLEWTTSKLLRDWYYSGLLLELYALEDIAPGTSFA